MVGCSCYDCAHLRRACDEDCRLQPDHLQIIVHRHEVHVLEIHIVLLPFAYFCRCLRKQLQCLWKHSSRCFRHQLVALDGHHVAGKDSRVFVPLAVDRRHSAPYVRLVHDVVMDQREAVEDLHGGSGREDLLAECVLVKGVGCEAETRADALSADLHHVSQRVIEPAWLLCEGQIAEQFLDG